MNQEKKDNKEKLSLLERVHQLDLRKTYKRLIYFGIAGAILLIGAFLLANKIFSLDLNFTTNAALVLSSLIAVYFGFFTISAYWVARKVEEYVRMPIRNYEDFIEQAKLVLEKGRGEYRLMVYYPYFSLDKKVRERGGGRVDQLILNLSEEPNPSIKILVLNEPEQDNFLKQMKDTLDIPKEVICEAQARYERLKKNIGKEKFRLYSEGRLPIHVFWSSTIVSFVAIEEPKEYPTPELKCSGFTSRDPDIKEAFRIIFDNNFNKSEAEDE